jgi:hypothetical protein
MDNPVLILVIGGALIALGVWISSIAMRSRARIMKFPHVEGKIVDYRVREEKDSEGMQFFIAAVRVGYAFDGRRYDEIFSPRTLTQRYNTVQGAEKSVAKLHSEFPADAPLVLRIDPSKPQSPYVEANRGALNRSQTIGMLMTISIGFIILLLAIFNLAR